MRMVRPWNRFSRQVLDAPVLDIFKARLDKAFSSLNKWKASLPMADPFQSKPCYDSVIP